MKMWNKITRSYGAKTMTCAAVLVCMTGLMPGRVVAQDLGLLTSTTSTTTAGALSTLGVVWLVMPRDKAKQSAAQYMNHNQAIFCETLITGRGQALQDLASMAGVPESHHEHFATILSEAIAPHKATLLSTSHYSEEHASILLDAIEQSIESDATLQEVSTLSM